MRREWTRIAETPSRPGVLARRVSRRNPYDRGERERERWSAGYNQKRQHSALGYRTPSPSLEPSPQRPIGRNHDQLRRSPVAPPGLLARASWRRRSVTKGRLAELSAQVPRLSDHLRTRVGRSGGRKRSIVCLAAPQRGEAQASSSTPMTRPRPRNRDRDDQFRPCDALQRRRYGDHECGPKKDPRPGGQGAGPTYQGFAIDNPGA